MRILPLSDLHREMYPDRDLGILLDVSRPDVVVLAGDIDKGVKAVEWAAQTFAGIQVIYVAGNHEYYGHKIDTMPAKIEAACAETDNVEFFNGKSCIVIDDVLFCGATLWTDFRLFGDEHREHAMIACQHGMNDYHQIRVASRGYGKFTVTDSAGLHLAHLSHITGHLNGEWNRKRVVISHMAPSMQSVPEMYKSHLLSAAYASNLDALAEKADLWIHGHTHTSMDYNIGKCRVIANPCGYRFKDGGNENLTFNPNLIIEI